MSKVKQQHTVPNFYLKNFTNSKGKIYAFDKTTSQSFQSVPAKIARQKGFYDRENDPFQKIEKDLGQIETDTSKVLSNLIERCRSTKIGSFEIKEREIISRFIMSQKIRTEANLNSISQGMIELQRQINEKADGFGIEEIKKLDSNELQLELLEMESVIDISKEIENRIWVIFQNNTRFEFVTSDHPVSSFKHGNIQNTKYEIFLPLSYDLLISILPKEQFPEFLNWNNKLIDLETKDEARWYNSVTIINAERQVYSRVNHFKFAENIIRDFPQYSVLGRQRVARN